MKPARKIRNTAPKVETAAPLEPEHLGPLWVITICMGAFFVVAALVMMAG